MVQVVCQAEVIYWRGPSPFYFAALSPEASAEVSAVAGGLSYGWGAIRADVAIGDVRWETAIFPKDGRYVVPLKVAIRSQLSTDAGATVVLTLTIGA